MLDGMGAIKHLGEGANRHPSGQIQDILEAARYQPRRTHVRALSAVTNHHSFTVRIEFGPSRWKFVDSDWDRAWQWELLPLFLGAHIDDLKAAQIGVGQR